jgi:tetratricopeptide (TPR) repeat protein
MRRNLFTYLLLTATTIAVFWQVQHYDFVGYDDIQYITGNHHVQAGLTLEGFIWAFTTDHASNWHPLTWLSHMLDCELYGLKPSGHHLTNLLFHLANTLLLFLVLKRITGAHWRSAFVAALFALHPLHVESVAWAAERKDVLSTFFWMLTLWNYVHYVEQPGFKRYLLVIFTFTLGLLAKPMLVTLPFVLLLLDFWPLNRYLLARPGRGNDEAIQAPIDPGRSRSSARGLVLEKAPLFALAAISSMVTFFAQQSGQAVRSVEAFPLTVRIANGLTSYVAYIGKTIWPADLAIFYPHPGDALPIWKAAGAGLLLVFISMGAIGAVKRYPYLTVGWLWYLGTLVPVIGLVQVGSQAMADRYTYVPLIGLFIIAAWGLYDLAGKWRHRRAICVIAAGAMLLALTICTWRQLHHWHDSISLWKRALDVTDENYVTHNNLGAALYEKDRLEEAIAHYYQALKIKPDQVEAHNNLAVALDKQGKVEEAIAHYYQALRIKPDYAEAHNNLGAALYEKDRPEEAIVHYYQALKIEADYAEAHNNLAVALDKQGKVEEAIAHYYQALRIKPDDAMAHFRLALALTTQGRTDEAINQYRQVLHFRPNWSEGLNNLAWIFATHENPKFRNGEKALQLAERACELTGYKQAPMLDTLAAAYAEAARFNDALQTAHNAVELALAAGEVELATKIERRMQLYKAGKPFHEGSASGAS